MPSSIPRPARRIGTTSGLGAARRMPVVGATGVVMSYGSTRTSRVASYASSVTSSSASRPERRGVGALVAQDRQLVGDERVVGDVEAHARTLTVRAPPERRP